MAMLDDLLWMPQSGATPWASVGLPGSSTSPDDQDPEAVWRRIEEQNRKEQEGSQRRNASALGATANVAPGPYNPYDTPDASSPAITSALNGQNVGAAANRQFPPVPLGPVGLPVVPSSAAPSAAPNAPPSVATPVSPASPAPPQAAGGQSNDDEEDGAKLPTSASATQGLAPLGAPAPSIWNRIGQGLTDNAPLLLALGSGLAGAPSFGEGVSRAFSNAAPIAQARQQYNQQMAGLNATAAALLKKGASQEDVVAAAQNPELMKALVGQYFGRDQYELKQTGEDAFGAKSYALINKYDPNDYKVWNGAKFVKPAEGDNGIASPIGGTPGAPAAGGGYLANGVTQLNSNLSGDAYLKQFSPEVQAAVHAYQEGRSQPTSNPRRGWSENIKKIAQKYGSDIGDPVDDATFSSRRKMQTDIGGSSPSSMGGILSNGKSSFEHLAGLSDRMVSLGNYNGPGIPGGALVAEGANALGNSLLPTAQTRDKMEALRDNALKYGQESTKFYSGTGGGAAERMHALNEVAGGGTTGAAQAGFLETEKELMTDRLREKEAQIRDVMGQAYLDKHPVMTPDLIAQMQKIDQNIAVLRGQAPQQQAAVAPVRVSSKAEYDAIPRGRTYVAPDGSVRTKQ